MLIYLKPILSSIAQVSRAFLCGGALYGTNYSKFIQRWTFSSETMSGLGNLLTVPGTVQAAVSSSSAGYVSIGSYGYMQVGAANYTNSNSTKFQFSTETASVFNMGSCQQYQSFCWSASDAGYWVVSFQEVSANTLSQLLYSTETGTMENVGAAPIIQANGGSCNNGSQGYAMGGWTTTYSNIIQALQFASKTIVGKSATLSVIRHGAYGLSSTTHGLACGGTTSSGGVESSEIDGILFATDTAVNPSAALAQAKRDHSSASGTTKGYCYGGIRGGVGYINDIDGIDFITLTAINPSAAMAYQTLDSGTLTN